MTREQKIIRSKVGVLELISVAGHKTQTPGKRLKSPLHFGQGTTVVEVWIVFSGLGQLARAVHQGRRKRVRSADTCSSGEWP